jgi:hypothetical protein
MSAVPAFFHYRTKVKEYMMNVRDLIRRIELLMRDERYPPLCIPDGGSENFLLTGHRRN